MLLSRYLNLGIIFLITPNVFAISHTHPLETSRRPDQQQISTPALQKRDVDILPWKRQVPGEVPEEGSEAMSADVDGSMPQGKSSTWLGDWWDGLKLNPFANDATDEQPEEGGGFFGGLFGSSNKEAKPPKDKEPKQPSKGIFGGLFSGGDKSEQEPQSSGKSWFKNPFGGGSDADQEPKSSGGSWFRNPFSSSNSDGASENAGSPVAEPAQDPGRGFDGPVGVGTQPIQTSMSPTVKSAAPGIDPASTLLNRQSRRRLRNYDTKEQKRIDTLNLTKQPIPPNDPSLLGITNPVERLRAYDARRDRQRQEQIRSDQAIKNGLLGQKGPLSAEEKKLLDNYDQIEMKNNAKSRILGITDPRKRLVQYKLRDKNKKPLTPMEQQRLEEFDRIEKQNPSSRILKTADPAARLKKYNDREAQRQKNAAAKNKSQPPRGQRGKVAVNSPLAPQQSTPNQPPKKQQVAKPIQENKQIASPAVKQPSRRVRKAQRKEAAATATATAAAQMAKAAPAGTTTSKQATSAPGNKAPQGPNRRERKAQMKVYVADAARKEKAARAAEAQKRLQEKKSATSVGVAAVKTQSTGKPEPMSEKEKAKANENMAAFANLPGLV